MPGTDVSLRGRFYERDTISIGMVSLLVIFHAPFVRTFVGARLAREFRLGVNALELPVPPERSVNLVRFTAVHANKIPFPYVHNAALLTEL